MGLSGQDNACASNHGLRGSVRLDELVERFDIRGRKLKGRQRKLMTHGAPPSLVGETFTSHEAFFWGKVIIYSLYNTSAPVLYS
jgi:hypothetical protein